MGILVPQVFADGSQRHPTDAGIGHGDSRECDQQQRYRHYNAAPIMLHVHFATTVESVLVTRPALARIPSSSAALPASAPGQARNSCLVPTFSLFVPFFAARVRLAFAGLYSNTINYFIKTILYLNGFS
jgi:hypothetical protein